MGSVNLRGFAKKRFQRLVKLHRKLQGHFAKVPSQSIALFHNIRQNFPLWLKEVRPRLIAEGVLFRKAFAIQVRTVHALLLREMKTRYGKHKLGFLWALAEPLAFVITLTVFFWLMDSKRAASGMPLIPFLMTGIIGYMLFRDSMGQAISSIRSNKGLLVFPQVTLFDLIAARALLEYFVAIVVYAILLVVASLLNEDVRIETPLGVLGILSLYSVMGTGLGMGFAALTDKFPSTQQFLAVATGRPLFFTSGLFFTADSLYFEVREILLWNPLLTLTELHRSFFFFSFESKYAQTTYAMYWVVGSVFWGLLMLSAFRKSLMNPS